MNNYCKNQIINSAPKSCLGVAFGYGQMTSAVICLAGAVFARESEFIKKKL